MSANPSLSSGKMVCTEPLPKVVSPITTARSQSCSAPETISAAEAEPASTSTTIGTSLSSRGAASLRDSVCSVRPRVETIRLPSSRKSELTSTACSSSPPGLWRRSSTSFFIPLPFSSSMAAARSSAVFLAKVITFT